MYAVWVKLGETLPWIELEGEFETREEARKAAKEIFNNTDMKIVRISEKERKAAT
ncbi:MAG: hypothetical protein GWN31_00530, partial [Candidatus Thorarchaeota archaeon]|nr:hypothetical protein [Candidatus Thorarchaeota archaeon]NIW12429.1 hypothetical protein [Candidatus Thorarchaeota archaeon]